MVIIPFEQITSLTYTTRMQMALLVIEIISGLLLIGAILLHTPSSDGMGAIGGQAQTFKPPQNEMESGLKKVTIILATLFFVSALILGLFY